MLASLLAACAFVAASCSRGCGPAQPVAEPNLQPHGLRADGRQTTEIFVNMPGHWDLGSPSISPDSKWIAFDALTIGDSPQRETWLVGVDGKGLRKLADGALRDGRPTASGSCSRRETVGLFSRQNRIYEIEIATGKEKLIRAGRFPDWSPDGKRMVFAAEGSRTENTGVHPGSKLWTANADGSGSAELCDGNWPSWSPDGKKIAYCVQEENKPGEIWVFDLDTKQQREDWPGPLPGAMGWRQQELRLQRLVSDSRRNDLHPRRPGSGSTSRSSRSISARNSTILGRHAFPATTASRCSSSTARSDAADDDQ